MDNYNIILIKKEKIMSTEEIKEKIHETIEDVKESIGDKIKVLTEARANLNMVRYLIYMLDEPNQDRQKEND